MILWYDAGVGEEGASTIAEADMALCEDEMSEYVVVLVSCRNKLPSDVPRKKMGNLKFLSPRSPRTGSRTLIDRVDRARHSASALSSDPAHTRPILISRVPSFASCTRFYLGPFPETLIISMTYSHSTSFIRTHPPDSTEDLNGETSNGECSPLLPRLSPLILLTPHSNNVEAYRGHVPT